MEHPRDLGIPLKLHSEVKALADEWSGISDPILRRKLQNRLNQRATRRRRKQTGSDQSPSAAVNGPRIAESSGRLSSLSGLIVFYSSASSRASDGDSRSTADTVRPAAADPFTQILRNKAAEDPRHGARLHNLSRERPEFLQSPRIYDMQGAANGYGQLITPLPADHLLTLIYYNVLRALVSNTCILGLDVAAMCQDGYASPFFTHLADPGRLATIPPSFHPTQLQTSIPHHPQWDIFPDPVIRDNVLSYGEENINDVELCTDLIGTEYGCMVADGGHIDDPNEDGDSQSRTGMIVWGEPWDIMSWEVTESFARKYSWFLVGAERLLNSTNAWRRKRGQPPIVFGEGFQ